MLTTCCVYIHYFIFDRVLTVYVMEGTHAFLYVLLYRVKRIESSYVYVTVGKRRTLGVPRTFPFTVCMSTPYTKKNTSKNNAD